MTNLSPIDPSAPDGAQPPPSGGGAPAPFAGDRHRVACAMLRKAGHLDKRLPGQRRGESQIDWLVRYGLAPDPQVAAEMLILGRGLTAALDELTGTAE